MTKREKDEFVEKLKNFSLKELICLLTDGKLDKVNTEIVQNFVCENYEEIPLFKFNKSIKEIPKDYPQNLKSRIMTARVCAREILERLEDLNDINSVFDIEAIVTHQMKVTKALDN